MKIHEEIEEKGYVVIKNILSKDEIFNLRSHIIEYFKEDGIYYEYGKTQPDGFGAITEIKNLLNNKNIKKALKDVFNSDNYLFTFHSDCHMNMLSGWHTDTSAYFDFSEINTIDFRVFKIAIYLQDHKKNNQGLTLEEFSHKKEFRTGNIEKSLITEAGDIVIFDTRIWHAGDKKTFFEKIISKIFKGEKIKFILGKLFRVIKNKKDKLSVFYTYGVPNNYTTEFAKRNHQRVIKQLKYNNNDQLDNLKYYCQHNNIKTVEL